MSTMPTFTKSRARQNLVMTAPSEHGQQSPSTCLSTSGEFAEASAAAETKAATSPSAGDVSTRARTRGLIPWKGPVGVEGRPGHRIEARRVSMWWGKSLVRRLPHVRNSDG